MKQALASAQAGNYDVAGISGKIDALLAENKVVVFSWTRCPFCVKAKGLLSDLGTDYRAVELDTMADGAAYRAELAKRTGRTSMPNIFIQGKNYGGCNDGPGVMTLHKRGELQPLLRRAGAL
ncbi:hypothetical protein WJX72_009339 [[Myrmecia] bisecta]|uniref:Glutaredoxin domain-containing protein n=1 Tax=[Myrmecia] bisecta TaxID=41462 RepID=A0AAW1PB77_9CHLO